MKRSSCTYRFCDRDITKFCLMLGKEFILTNTWIVEKDLTKQSYQQNENFRAT